MGACNGVGRLTENNLFYRGAVASEPPPLFSELKLRGGNKNKLNDNGRG